MHYQDLRDRLLEIVYELERGGISRTMAASDLRRILQDMKATDIAASLESWR